MAGSVPGRQCLVCSHAARTAAEHWIRTSAKSMNNIALELGVSRHSVNRHAANCMEKTAGALVASGDKDAAAVVQQSARDLANSQRDLVTLIDEIVDKARGFLDKFGDSDNAKDIKAALDTAISAARLLGDKQGAFPRAPQVVNDNRSISLNGLSPDDLRALIAGIKSQQQDTFEG